MEGWEYPDSEARRSRSFSPKDVEVDGRPALQGLSLRGRSVESLAYLTALIGTVGDHLSTRIGLLYPRIRELNPFTVYLRQNALRRLLAGGLPGAARPPDEEVELQGQVGRPGLPGHLRSGEALRRDAQHHHDPVFLRTRPLSFDLMPSQQGEWREGVDGVYRWMVNPG